MNIIGEKIRMLRRNKNITQEELAEILLVSPQAISKWENKQSVPDIQLLPVIARYFGITMDEIFNYRLDALNYKERFIRFMVDNGALKFGEFKLNRGRISPCYIDTSGYKSASQITKLGEFYAECIRENNVEMDILYGNTEREIPMMISTSMILYKKYGMDMRYCISNKKGTVLKPGMDVVIIEDTLTTGNTLRETIHKLQNDFKVNVVAAVVLVDRQEKKNSFSETARDHIEKEYGVKIFPIVMLDDIINAMKNGVISAEYLNKMIQYREEHGGRNV